VGDEIKAVYTVFTFDGALCERNLGMEQQVKENVCHSN
jgi:hypothetical protein